MPRLAPRLAAVALLALCGACVSSVERPQDDAARAACAEETNPSVRRSCRDGVEVGEHSREDRDW